MTTLHDTLHARDHRFRQLPAIGAGATPQLLHALSRNYQHPDGTNVSREHPIIVHDSHPTGIHQGFETAYPCPNTSLNLGNWRTPAYNPEPTLPMYYPYIDDHPLLTVVPGIVYMHTSDNILDTEYNDENYVHLMTLAEIIDAALTWADLPDDIWATEATTHTPAEHPVLTVLRHDPSEIRTLRTDIDSTLYDIARSDQQITRLQQNAEAHDIRLRNLQTELDNALAAHADSAKIDLDPVLDYLDNQPLIDTWYMPTDGALRVITKPLCMSHEDIDNGDDIPLGAFALTFWSGGDTRCVNLNNRRGRRDHPHIVEGAFCTGAYGSTIRTLLQRGELIDAINLILNFLQTFAPEDEYGRTYYLWSEHRGDLSNFEPPRVTPGEADDPNFVHDPEYD